VLLLEVSTLQGPELHLDVSALQRSVLLLEVSATGPELYLDVSALQRNVLLLEVSTLQGPELHLDVSAVLHYRGMYCSWRGLPPGLNSIWTRLHYSGMCLIHRD